MNNNYHYDPFFGIYITSKEPVYTSKRKFTIRKDRHSFYTEEAKKIGILPEFFTAGYKLHDIKNIKSELHHHSFLEMVMITSGKAFYHEEKLERELCQGEILLINHLTDHVICSHDPDCTLINIWFRPEDIENNISLNMGINTLIEFTFLRPFYNNVSRNKINIFDTDRKFYFRLLHSLLQLLHIFNTSVDNKQQILRFQLSVSLSILYDFYKTHILHNTDIGASFFSVIHYLQEHYTEKISIDALASQLGINKFSFSKKFNKTFGQSIPEYINTIRINHAKELLGSGNFSVIEIANMLGFFDNAHFCKTFKSTTGMSPADYRKKNKKL